MVRTPEGCVVDICTKCETDISIRSKVIRGPKISKFGHMTQATPTYGSFYGSHTGGCVDDVCTKFEATPVLNFRRLLCVEIHLRILAAKFCCSILIRC